MSSSRPTDLIFRALLGTEVARSEPPRVPTRDRAVVVGIQSVGAVSTHLDAIERLDLYPQLDTGHPDFLQIGLFGVVAI